MPATRSFSICRLLLRGFVLGALVLGALMVPVLSMPQRAFAANSVSDNFNRVNGTLGAGWTDMTDGGLAISSQVVTGTKAAYSGDIRTGETYTSDQSSQIQVTATQLSGGQWIGPAVRAQNGGQNLYLGIYFWNNGSPQLMLFKRIGGGWTQLGSSYSSGALGAGTTLTLTATGSTLSFAQNGVARITATDTSLTGGAPGIMAYGTPQGDNWVGVGATQAIPTYSVGGTISGLSGTVVLEDNGGNDLSTSANGTFTFSTPLAQGTAYNVTVKTNPSGQVCSVTNPSGTVASANVTNVSVTCVTIPTYSVGGTTSGLSGTVVLEDNGGNDLSTSANGTFTFSTPLAQGTAYNVTVKTNPSGQVCSVTNPSGTVASATVTNVSVTCVTQVVNSVSDNFNRVNGTLGAGWTDMTDGGLAISSQVVTGTKAAYSGDIRTGETYTSDQSSQIQVTATQLSGGQWIGPAVRAQNGGQNLYLGIYFWNNGSPQLMLFKRIGGGWTQLGSSYSSGALGAGTTLTLTATGSTLSFAQNGVARITATDTSLTGGAPGIMAYGTPQGDNWVGVGATQAIPTYSVGGTISGLSGTVVLEDNGGNDLSTSANGTFTFSTPLAQGTAYNVTVKTNPSGQVCSVTNPSGTVASATVTNVSVTCVTQVVNSVSDNFNRVNGTLGAGWTDMTDGGLAISSQVVTGTKAAYSGDIRTGETYTSDQSSQIQVTATQLSGGQWIGPAVRAQNGGQNLYLGIYFWNNGSPQLMLFKRIGGGWTQLGSSYSSGALGAGTTLTLTATGSTLSFAQNGVARITATDTSLTGGAPGIMAYGTPQGDNWVGVGATQAIPTYSVGGTISGLSGTVVLEDNGGNDLSTSANGTFTFSTPLAQGTAYNVTVKTNPSGQVCSVTNPSGTVASANVTNVSVTCVTQVGNGFSVQYVSTDANNIEYFSFTSANDGYGTQTLRVLLPTHPAAGVAHNFLFVLPVESGLGSAYGDGMDTMLALDAQDQYDLTIVEPTFSIDPWYADNPNDANLQYETFMTTELEPWVKANLSTTGTEQNWLIGFSKSGIGAQDLILKHPDLFQLAASWDFPADMSAYDEYGTSSADDYGTDANFQANYRLSPAFLDAHKAPFLTNNRIWIGGYNAFQTDVSDYDALLTSEGILHTVGPSQLIIHSWDSGWVPAALAALYQDSTQQH